MIYRSCLRTRNAGFRVVLSPRQTARTQSLSSTVACQRAARAPLPTLARPLPTALQIRRFSDSTVSREQLAKPDTLTDGEARVWDRVVAELAPTQLVVQDISGGCGSMYFIDVSSERFRGLGMLRQQRLVNAALGDIVKEWHGVQLKTRVP